MGKLFSYFLKKEEVKPPPEATPKEKLLNAARLHYRGLLGFFVPLILFLIFFKKGDRKNTIMLIWVTMIFEYIIKAVYIPVVGLIPMFALPMTGTYRNDSTAKGYFNEAMIMFIIGGMCMMLLNQCNFHKRLILMILKSSRNSSFKPSILLLKISLAAFITSMISHRVIASGTVMDIVQPALETASTATAAKSSEPDFSRLNNYMYGSIISSSCIGSIVFIHGTFHVLFVRGLFDDYSKGKVKPKKKPEPTTEGPAPARRRMMYTVENYPTVDFLSGTESVLSTAAQTLARAESTMAYLKENTTVEATKRTNLKTTKHSNATRSPTITFPGEDFTNEHFRYRRQDEIKTEEIYEGIPYIPYMLYSIPMALVLFLANYIYNAWILHRSMSGSNSPYTLNALKDSINKESENIGSKLSTHEIQCLIVFIGMLIALLTRYNDFGAKYAWKPGLTTETTVLAITLLVTQLLPKTLNFTKTFSIKKKSVLNKSKPESAWMYWKYINKFTCYSYIFVLGAGWAMTIAAKDAGWDVVVSKDILDGFVTKTYVVALFTAIFIAAVLSNLLAPVVVVSAILPLYFMAAQHAPKDVNDNIHFLMVASAIATNFNYFSSFQQMPSRYIFKQANLNPNKMAAYGLGGIFVCCMALGLFTQYVGGPLYWLCKDCKYGPSVPLDERVSAGSEEPTPQEP